jgi:hypothetical protein
MYYQNILSKWTTKIHYQNILPKCTTQIDYQICYWIKDSQRTFDYTVLFQTLHMLNSCKKRVVIFCDLPCFVQPNAF